jgi:hypothetical protein
VIPENLWIVPFSLLDHIVIMPLRHYHINEELTEHWGHPWVRTVLEIRCDRPFFLVVSLFTPHGRQPKFLMAGSPSSSRSYFVLDDFGRPIDKIQFVQNKCPSPFL